MARKLDKLDKGRKRKCDKKDAQILAVKVANPDATVREIAEQTGIPPSTVHYRLKDIPDTEEYQQAAKKCLGLMVYAAEVYERRLLGEDPQGLDLRAAHQLLTGLGLFGSKHTMELSGNVGIDDPSGITALLRGADPGLLRELADFLRRRIGEAGDAAPVLGETFSPNREGDAT